MSSHVFNPAPNDQEIVRWGDRQTLFLPVTEIITPKTIQLVKVHRHIPESWTLTLFAHVLDTAPIGPTFDVFVFFDLIIGSGSAQINLRPTIRMQSAAAAVVQDYNSLVTPRPIGFLVFQLPANDIQIQVTDAQNNASPAVNIDVAAMAAPRYSPPTPGDEGGPQESPGHQQMVSPFYPEPLVYR